MITANEARTNFQEGKLKDILNEINKVSSKQNSIVLRFLLDAKSCKYFTDLGYTLTIKNKLTERHIPYELTRINW